MSEPLPPGAEDDEPLPPGAEEEGEEVTNVGLEKQGANHAPSPAGATSSVPNGVPDSARSAGTSSAQVADPYAGYPGYDPNAAGYDYSAYWAAYGYQPSAYYSGYYPGYEAYDASAYAAYGAQPATSTPSASAPTLAPPSTSTSAVPASTGGQEVKEEADAAVLQAKEEEERVQASKAEEEERQRAEEERVKAAQEAAEEATRAAAEEAARQAAEQKRLAEEAAVRAQNLAMQRAQAEQVRMGPTPEVLERIQKELAEAQEAAERKKAAEEEAAAEAARAAAAAAAAAPQQGASKKKPISQNMLKGAKMAFSGGAPTSLPTTRATLSKVFAEPAEAEEAELESAPSMEKQRSTDRAAKLYLPEPLARANRPDFQNPAETLSRHSRGLSPPPRQSYSRSRSRSLSRSRTPPRRRSRSRGRSDSRSPSRPSRSPSARGLRRPTLEQNPGRFAHGSRGYQQRGSGDLQAAIGSYYDLPEPVAPPQNPVAVAPAYMRQEYDGRADFDSDRQAKRERRKRRHRHREALSAEDAAAVEEELLETKKERRRKHRRHKHRQHAYDEEDQELQGQPFESQDVVQPSLPAQSPTPPRVQQPVATRRSLEKGAQPAPVPMLSNDSSEHESLPSPPRIADLRRKYAVSHAAEAAAVQAPRPLSPSPPPASVPATSFAAPTKRALPSQEATGFNPQSGPRSALKLPAQVIEAAQAVASKKQESLAVQESTEVYQQQPADVSGAPDSVPGEPLYTEEAPSDGYERRHGASRKKQRREYSSLSDEEERRREKHERKKRKRDRKLRKERRRLEEQQAAYQRSQPDSQVDYRSDPRGGVPSQKRSLSHSHKRSRTYSRSSSYSSRSRSFSRSRSPSEPRREYRSPKIPKRMRMDEEAVQRPSSIAAEINKAAEAARRAASRASVEAVKSACKVYVGGFPQGFREADVKTLFTEVMAATGYPASVMSAYLNTEKRFAFVEFTSREAATRALQLDNLSCQGAILKVRRPHDYKSPDQPVPMPASVPSAPSKPLFPLEQPSTAGSQAPPPQVAPQPLPAAVPGPQPPRFEPQTQQPAVEQKPVQAAVAPRSLAAAPQGHLQAAVKEPLHAPTEEPTPNVAKTAGRPPPLRSKVLRLANMVERDDLLDDEEYADIVDDIRDEVERKYGKLQGIKVPRPSSKQQDPPGVGLVFLSFETDSNAQKAQAALNGRKFGENTVVSSYFDEDLFVASTLS